jgi:hypothetical protein
MQMVRDHQNPAIKEEWDNIPQANQQPDKLYAKEMCSIA